MAQVPKAHGEQHGAAMGARAEAARFAAAPGPAPAAAGTATGHQDGPPGQGQAPTAEVAGARTVHQDGAPGPAPTPTGTPAVPPQDAGARAGWLASVRVGVGWAVVVRVAALLVATGSRWMLQEGSRGSRPLGDALGVWYRWDAINLAQIARHGYLSDTPDPAYPAHQTAFFPGFPLALRAVGWLVGDL